MTARIYTAAEAEALRKAATPRPWRTYGNAAHDDAPSDAWTIEHDGDTLAELRADDRPQYGDASDEEVAEVVEADADLMAAAPDLAASVAFHARRAEKAEAELIEAHDRARDAEAERAAAEAALTAVWQAITDDDLPRLATGDGTIVDAEAVGRRVAALVSQRDTANADFVGAADGGKHLARQVDHLEGVLSSLVRGVLDAIGARDRAVPNLPFSTLAAWLATETRLVVDDLAMTRDNHHARATKAEAERDAAIARADERAVTLNTYAQNAADLRDERDALLEMLADRRRERDAALSQAEELTRALRVARESAQNAGALARVHREERDAEHAAAMRLHAEVEALRAAARRVAASQRAHDLALTDLFSLVPAEEAPRG